MRHDCGMQTPVDIPNRPRQHFVLASESAAEFARIRLIWYGEFNPSDRLEHEFVERLVEADWRRQRAQRCLMLLEERLFSRSLDFSEWSADDRRNHAFAQKYLNSAARDFEQLRRQLNDQRRVRMLQVSSEYRAHDAMVKDRRFFPTEPPPGPATLSSPRTTGKSKKRKFQPPPGDIAG